jgi:ATP-dependent Lon protease
VVLDELDKTEQVRQYDPLAALYTLLEPAAHGPSRTSLSVISPSMPATSTGSRRQTAWMASRAHCCRGSRCCMSMRLHLIRLHASPRTSTDGCGQKPAGALPSYPSRRGRSGEVEALPPRSLGLALRRALGHAARDQRDHIQQGPTAGLGRWET